MTWLAVFLGGGLGSLCRYAISKISIPYWTAFPTQTLLANILASALLGFLSAYFLVKTNDASQSYKLFAATGFCGGFSTFSTFSLETFQLMQNGRYGLAILYVSLSILICVLGVALGFWMGK